MTAETLVSLAYRYARSACASTWLDYRDVAHSAIVRVMERGCESVDSPSYIWHVVKTEIATLFKRQYPSNIIYGISLDIRGCDPFGSWHDRESILEAVDGRALEAAYHILAGFSFAEAAGLLECSESTISVIFFRIRKKTRRENHG